MKLLSKVAAAAAVGVAGAVAAVAISPSAVAATSPTIVTIQFDDGNADQYLALPILGAHGMHATYYVNSGPVGDADHMTWSQLSDLAAAGHEIAGHTVTHANVNKLKTGPARQEICGDRVTLFNHGFAPVSFAYPFGSFDSASEQIVADCGYNSGRGVSGVDGRRVFAETIPPADAFATRTPANVKSGMTLADVQGFVTGAEQHGGGWVQIVIHHLCDRCDAYSMTVADFTGLVDWLAARAGGGTLVQTTAQVVGGPVKPPVAP